MSTTLLPFLYQTRTIQRLSQTRVSTPALRAFFHATAAPSAQRRKTSPRAGSAIPFEFPPGSEHLNPNFSIGDIPRGHQPTITPSERSTFAKIFEEIAARGKSPAQSTLPASLIDAAIQPPGAEQPPADGSAESHHNAIGVILKDAAAAQSGSWRPALQPFSQNHLVGQMTAAADPMKALMRFPPALREAARAAFSALESERPRDAAPVEVGAEDIAEGEGAVKKGAKKKKVKAKSTEAKTAVSPLMVGIDLEQQRAAERERVEKKMQEAETDFALWDVLEREVFSIVPKLGLSDGSKEEKLGGKKPAAKAPEKTLSMNIHGALYPLYLQTAVRLMDGGFARSSPLTLNILPRIKALGLSSYLLGVSTSFYNTLAWVHWYRHGDAQAVLHLLEEMRHAGLLCDSETLAIVHNISQVFQRSASGDAGPFLQEVVSLPEYEFAIGPQIEHWMKAIRAQMFEQEQLDAERR
ncbi:hypothetical protein QBC34DRAFT_418317 [Podospora aff. communis PSN243]|uniref:Mtf2-like C-terminal domain-containing protein n=1 Tax=Podospora aff. communis PSN243 TaxID=3040156 RepID=A0AAV9G3T6_9PEZI|nr:hypothetical protein QBC34DRAFT_418317 [Podospora aff. communis PSN243]